MATVGVKGLTDSDCQWWTVD